MGDQVPKAIVAAIDALFAVLRSDAYADAPSLALYIRRDGRIELESIKGIRKFDSDEGGTLYEMKPHAYPRDRSDP
jgi:hypothetical protein